jgi:hypothetical protein
VWRLVGCGTFQGIKDTTITFRNLMVDYEILYQWIHRYISSNISEILWKVELIENEKLPNS